LVITWQALSQDELPFRRMDYYSWKEFASLVPDKVDTVILPVGTQEAHGVVANGADALVPERLAAMVAEDVNAFAAPVIPYGRTTSLAAYPGGFAISKDTFTAYCLETVEGLAKCGFRNIIIFNGHGPNRAPLDTVAEVVASKHNVRILVIDWWSYCADVTQEVWGDDEDGGHAGLNENAAVMALNPQFARPDLYDKDMTVPIDSSYTAYPNPGTILLYTPGKGYPEFDQARARKYLERVADELSELVIDTRVKWDNAGF
jgi:creatinine amidohydrolase